VIDRSRSKTSGIRAKSQSSNTVTVVTENLGSGGRKKRVMNRDGDIGRGGGDEMFGFLVPYERAEGSMAAFLGVGLPHFH